MSDTKIDVLDATQKVGEQFVAAIKQGQGLYLDVVRAFAEALPAVPSRLTDNPAAGALPDIPALTAYGFDLAVELLEAQKDFAVTLAGTFSPAKSA
jgi:hypothetical protein